MTRACPARWCAAFLLFVSSAASIAAAQDVTASPAPPVPVEVDQAQASLDRLARARNNLVLLRDGRLSVSALSPEELQDVLDLDRMVRSTAGDTPSVRQQCVDDEVRRAGGRPSRLAWEVIRLKCR